MIPFWRTVTLFQLKLLLLIHNLYHLQDDWLLSWIHGSLYIFIVILYQGSTWLWVSKLYTYYIAALSNTAEGEYVLALSRLMRDLIIMCDKIWKEIMTDVFYRWSLIAAYHSTSKRIRWNRFSLPIEVYNDNAGCLKSANAGQLSPRNKHIGLSLPRFWSKATTSLDAAIFHHSGPLGWHIHQGLSPCRVWCVLLVSSVERDCRSTVHLVPTAIRNVSVLTTCDCCW